MSAALGNTELDVKSKSETWPHLLFDSTRLTNTITARLGDTWWGDQAAAGNEWTQSYLLQLEGTRKQAVASDSICTGTAGDGARAHGFGYG
jgi:hypothetical protein